MKSMKAVRIHSYGEVSGMVYEDAPVPQPGDEEVLVRVHATSVNPFDWKVRRGYLAGWLNHTLPLIPGWDVSGVVEAVGSKVTMWRPGDEVFGMAGAMKDGAAAEYIAVPAAMLAHKPRSIGHLFSGSVPQACLTAWQSLFDSGGLQAGQRVLIHAAAGGVGHYAVQLAKQRGAYVVGTASAHNVEFVRSLGADEVIDYHQTSFEERAKDIDVVVDTIGGETLKKSMKTLKPGGILVSVVESPAVELGTQYGVRLSFLGASPNADELRQIAELVDSGKLKPFVSAIYPLSDLGGAHTQSEGLHTRGKIAVQVVA
jgi:NADPH:quinone reductase-like Zn-dependent oxidoreductase